MVEENVDPPKLLFWENKTEKTFSPCLQEELRLKKKFSALFDLRQNKNEIFSKVRTLEPFLADLNQFESIWTYLL